MTYPGGDTIGIVEMQPTTDPPTLDSMRQPITQPVVIAWSYGWVFESIERGPVEEQSDTITSHERAWAFGPYLPGQGIPTVDVNGDPVLDDDGNPVCIVVNNANYLQPKRPDADAARNYKVFGRPELEYDIDGVCDHVWITCEWRGG